MAILIVYFSVVILFWKQDKSLFFMVVGQSVWMILLAYVCSFFGALQVPILLAALTYAFIGFIYNFNTIDEYEEHSANDRNKSILDKCAHYWGSPIVRSTPNRVKVLSNETITSPTQQIKDENPPILVKKKLELDIKAATQTDGTHAVHFDETTKKSQSAIYFKALFLACLVTILYKQLLVLLLSFIPVLIYLLNKAIVIFGIKDYTVDKLHVVGKVIQVIRDPQINHVHCS